MAAIGPIAAPLLLWTQEARVPFGMPTSGARLRRTLPRNIGEGKNNISGVWMAGSHHPYPRPHKSAMDFKNRRDP
jgi:hypothetical protein